MLSLAAQTESRPEAARVLDRYVEVTGGREAYAKLQTRVCRGTMDLIFVGVKSPITIRQARPAKGHLLIESDAFGILAEGTDGDVAWTNSLVGGPRIRVTSERAYAVREAALDAPVRWREDFEKVECPGVEEVAGTPCYKLVLTPHEGHAETRYYAEDSGLLVRTELLLDTEQGPIPAVIDVGDYRRVDGVLIPHSIRHTYGAYEALMTIESVKHNTPIPDEQFEPPADVKALLKKKQDAANVKKDS